MKSKIVEQECENCGNRFYLKYFEDGSYEYISPTCDCESEFHPINGEPSISQWLQFLLNNK